MLRFIKGFFAKPKQPDTLAPVAPYKLEAPVTDWPFPKASNTVPESTAIAATAAVKKPRAPAKPKTITPVTSRSPRTRKTPAK